MRVPSAFTPHASEKLITGFLPLERRHLQGVFHFSLVFLLGLLVTLVGCGAGGYFGGGAITLSASAVTIDAGQVFPVSTKLPAGETASWSLAGTACPGGNCGSLSTQTGLASSYTAPAGLSVPLKVTVTASVPGLAETATLSITVNPDPVISGTPPAGTVGTPYSTTVTASGGTAPLTWSLASGALPAGLTFNAATGVIAGTPTAAGTASFALQAVDSSAIPFTVTAPETISITTAALALTLTGNPPAGTVGAAYMTALQAAGGTAPYSFSLVAGTLPAGLALAPSTGLITGTPTASGSSVFTAQVQDATGLKTTGVFGITIAAAQGTLSLTTAMLPNGTVGIPYSATIGVTGGNAPYACVFTSGTLPAGLSLSGCVVSGTPTLAGTSNLVVKATDSSSPSINVSGPEAITIAPAGLAISTGTLPNGTVAVPYSATIGVTGGTSPYSCTIISGTLPAGLALGANCLVSGTPTIPGTSSLVVKATDSSNPALTTTGPVSITILPSGLAISTGTLPNGTVGVVYTSAIGVTGGTAPYSCSITAGTLPAGLALGANCLVSGTPTTAGTASLTVKATDSSNPILTATGPVSITIAAAPVLVISSPPAGTVGVIYSGTIPVTGGKGPYSCKVTAGTLPNGLSLAGCLITGTPVSGGTVALTVQATDSSAPPTVSSGPVTITINPAPLAITTGTLPNGTVGVVYSSTIGVSGGTAPYSCSLVAGTLQAGLALGPNCLVSGTPTVSGTVNLSVKATDSENPAVSTTGPVALTIVPVASAITIGNPPPGMVGVPYSGPIPVSGGTGPYTCHLSGGTLPAGLTLNNCLLTGTPVLGGPVTITIGVTDSGNPPVVGTGPVTITINPAPLAITTGTLPNGTVGVVYSSTIGVNGGTAPYSCSLVAGTLQAGLALGPNCLVSGTPTVSGTVNLTVKATDSENPTVSTTGPVALTIVPVASAITIGNPPPGMVGVPYSGPIPVSGGTGPYTCHLSGGTLPAGLTLNNCLLTGTPVLGGPVTITIGVTDSGNPPVVGSGPVTITINPAPLAITTGTLPNGTVGVAYSSTIGVSGGTAPYSCTITSGTLQAGLTLGANCLVSGTPTVASTVSLMVKATDSENPAVSTTGPVSLTINPAPATLTIGNPPVGTVGVVYNNPIPISGGTGPYTCHLTGGSVPAGLTLNNCLLTGTPITGGPITFTIGVVDSSNPPVIGSGPVTVTINNPSPILTLSNPPTATVGTPYTGTIPVAGGTAPYTCSLVSGTVPAGLTLTGCILAGTPTTAVVSTLTVTATDSSNPQGTITGPVVVTVQPIPTLTFTGSLPNAVVGVAYTQTLQATGGVAPYTYAVTAGALPPGLTLSTAGVVSGTPTAVGAYSFTATATDSEATPQTASLPLVLLVTYASTTQDTQLKGPYAFLFQGYDDVAVGLAAYQTATTGSFTADGAGVLANGELDSNHQGSNPAGATIASNTFVGTYTVGADNRGFLTITTLNADGTVGRTNTYAISIKAPVAPATTSAQGSLIEFDSNQLAGTKGSGTFLQQTAASFGGGLTGSYAYGLSGDTPCLPACTVGIVAGPVASVGQFTVSGGTLSGTSDANIASTKYSSQPVSGTYGSADGNGRVQVSLATAGTPAGIYPSDYALYMVDANHAFILSTDKHSAAILLAGSAQSQTLSIFQNTSLTGPFIGYENAASNPGVTGATLANTLNLSTATIFRQTSDGAGTCTTTSVDTGGTTQLVNQLTGLGSGSPIINALLGTYQSTGNAACTVGGNGRAILNYPAPGNVLSGTLGLLGLPVVAPPARVAYLAGANRGYFLETGYAGLGQIEPQTGAPYSLATFNGTYIYGETPASSVATTNASGSITANGNGTATSLEDLNVGVGTINVLTLGVGHNDTYTAPDPTTGRFFFNDTTVADTSVVYVISPGRFVLLDTNPATTSPSVTVLY